MAMTFADFETAQPSGPTGTVTGTLSGFAHQAGWMVGIAPSAAPASGLSSAFLPFFP
jgi:hypothetical protein